MSVKENKRQGILSLQRQFIGALQVSGLNLHTEVACHIRQNRIMFGTNIEKEEGYPLDWASDISLYPTQIDRYPMNTSAPTIAVSSTGEFDPQQNEVAKWRINISYSLESL